MQAKQLIEIPSYFQKKIEASDEILSELHSLYFYVDGLQIKNEKANNQAIDLYEKLAQKRSESNLKKEHLQTINKIIEKITDKIDTFENGHYENGDDIAAIDLIKFLMEENGLEKKDMVEFMGSRGHVSDILNGKRDITKAIAKNLGDRFKIAPSAFMDW